LNSWLTIDSDDLRHLPIYQGHPTRSKNTYSGNKDELSREFRLGWTGFVNWMHTHDMGITLFVITDLFESEEFCMFISQLLTDFSDRITFGCHGHTHRSWSAWPRDDQGFSTMLETSESILTTKVGSHYRRFFRAPNGYIAPWMASILSRHGFLVDSSINPSWLVKKKSASSWKKVRKAMLEHGIVEREWLTSFGLPCNGPALFRFPLAMNSKRAWKKAPSVLKSIELEKVVNEQEHIVTLYCHILDFARKNGTWVPPLF